MVFFIKSNTLGIFINVSPAVRFNPRPKAWDFHYHLGYTHKCIDDLKMYKKHYLCTLKHKKCSQKKYKPKSKKEQCCP